MQKELRLLVIEDCISTYDILIRKLIRSGYDVHAKRIETEESMREALKSGWDIIISDNVMPKFNGLTALEVRNLHAQTVPFILFSGEITNDQIRTALGNGCLKFIMKGNFNAVVETVDRLYAELNIVR